MPACARSACPGRRGRKMWCSQEPPGFGLGAGGPLPTCSGLLFPVSRYDVGRAGGGRLPCRGGGGRGGLVLAAAWPASWLLVKTTRLLPPPPLQRKLGAQDRSAAWPEPSAVCVGLAGGGGAAPTPRFPSAPGRRRRLNSPGSGCHLIQLLEMKTCSSFAGACSLAGARTSPPLPPSRQLRGRGVPSSAAQQRSRQERPAPPNQ